MEMSLISERVWKCSSYRLLIRVMSGEAYARCSSRRFVARPPDELEPFLSSSSPPATDFRATLTHPAYYSGLRIAKCSVPPSSAAVPHAFTRIQGVHDYGRFLLLKLRQICNYTPSRLRLRSATVSTTIPFRCPYIALPLSLHLRTQSLSISLRQYHLSPGVRRVSDERHRSMTALVLQ